MLQIILSVFPKTTLNERGVALWYEAALEACSYEMGMAIAADLVATPDPLGPFPTPAQFNALRLAYLRRDQMTQIRERDEGDPTQLPPSEASKKFDQFKATLANPKAHHCAQCEEQHQ